MICIGATIVLLSFLYCLPYSISYVEIIGFMEIATFGTLINYSSYIIAIYLAKINLLNKIIDKTSGLIIGILVCTQKAKEKVETLNLDMQVAINKDLFFQ